MPSKFWHSQSARSHLANAITVLAQSVNLLCLIWLMPSKFWHSQSALSHLANAIKILAHLVCFVSSGSPQVQCHLRAIRMFNNLECFQIHHVTFFLFVQVLVIPLCYLISRQFDHSHMSWKLVHDGSWNRTHIHFVRPITHWQQLKIRQQTSAPGDSAGRVTDAHYQHLHLHTSNTHTQQFSLHCSICMAKSRDARTNCQNGFIQWVLRLTR